MKYILKNKEPVLCEDFTEWGKWFNVISNRIVAKDKVGNEPNEVMISTVFLGMDHNWSGKGDPILFETMVFGGELNEDCERYCTWEEAEKGHEMWIKKVKKTINDS